jgi:flagellin-specific chaperone FliS
MNPYARVSRQATDHLPRIDVILRLQDGAIHQLELALAALQNKREIEAQSFLIRAQLYLVGLVKGLDVSQGEIPANCLRLYEFAVNCIEERSIAKLEGALKVLQTLNEAFEGIRDEAVRLERTGEIPSLNALKLVEATV